MNPHILGHTLAMLTTFIRDSQVQNIDFTSGVLAEDDIANASLLRDPNKRGTINNKSYSFEWELMNAARGVAKHIHDGVTKSSIPDTTDSERHDFLALTSEYCPSLASIESGQMLIGLVHTELYALEAGSYKGDMYNGVEISKMENFRSQAERALSRNSIELLEVCIETFKSWVDIET